MENLNSKTFYLFLTEMIAVYLMIVFDNGSGITVPLLTFWYISVVVLNIIAVIFLIRFKPKYYPALIFMGTSIVVLPMLFLFMLSQVKMC